MSDLELAGAVWTGQRIAGSLRIRDGRVAALDEPAGFAAVDIGRRFALPGFVDAHMHLLLGGAALARLDLAAVDDREAFESAIERHHRELPPDRWLLAHGWSSERWGGADPDKTWLRAAGQRPVVCTRVDLHAVLVNDAVLARCDTSGDPPGGRIVRRADGEPTGLMLEAAAWRLVNPLIPDPGPEVRREALRLAEAHCCAAGLTAVGSMEYARDVEAVFRPARDRLALRHRITLLDREWPIDTSYGAAFDGDLALDVVGYKAFADGTMASRTARMLEDYDDDPGNRGLWVELAAEGRLAAWARRVEAAGLSPAIHAIGDAAVRAALDAVETVGRACRPRIEHAQQIDPADVARFAGIVTSMQPLHLADDGCYLPRALGPWRCAGSFAFRSLHEAGARLAFGSDWPVVAPDPIAGLRAAITGLTRDGARFLERERLPVAAALEAYTAGAAEAIGLEGGGRLAPGSPADATILDRDPFRADWVADPPRVVATIIGGRVVYDRDGVFAGAITR